MSTPRETQFAGFAKLLVDQMLALPGVVVESAYEYAPAEWEKIIAQRAFLLAIHVVQFTSERNLKMMHAGMLSAAQCVDQIPDMVDWPKEDEEEHNEGGLFGDTQG